MSSILEEAIKLVHKERRKEYALPHISFPHIAKLWSAYKGVEFSPEDVSLMMILFKISREYFNPKRDNRADIAGYAETLQMIHDNKPVDNSASQNL
jgi:hypothetical protein